MDIKTGAACNAIAQIQMKSRIITTRPVGTKHLLRTSHRTYETSFLYSGCRPNVKIITHTIQHANEQVGKLWRETDLYTNTSSAVF